MRNRYQIEYSNATDAYFLFSGMPNREVAAKNPGQALRSFLRSQGTPESWIKKYAPSTDDTESDRCLAGFGSCHRNIWITAKLQRNG